MSILAIVGFVKANKAIIGYATAVAGLLMALYQVGSAIYETGRESMRTELIAEHNKAMEAAKKEYEDKVSKALKRIQKDHADELVRVRNEQVIVTKVKKVIEYVDKEIVVQAECDALANSVVVVLKQAIDIVNGTSSTASP